MKRLAIYLLIFKVLTASAQSAGNVALTWNPVSNPIVAGYNIYFGGASRVYTNKTSAGLATTLTLSNLTIGSTYYFAVTTYSAAGAESALSSEMAYTLPAPPPRVQLLGVVAHQAVLSMTGTAGHTYDIQASEDLKTWTIIGIVTAGIGGSLTFTDTNAANYPRRFYRTLDTLP